MDIKLSRRESFDFTLTMNKILASVAGLSTEKSGSSYLKMDVTTSTHNSIHCLAGFLVSNNLKALVLGKRKDIGLIVYVPWDNHRVFVKYFKNSSDKDSVLDKLSRIGTFEEFYERLRFLKCLEFNRDLAQYWSSL